MTDPSPVLFREEQRFTRTRLWVFVVVAACVAWAGVAAGLVTGDSAGDAWVLALVAVLVGVGVPVLFAVARLTVEVRAEAIEIRYRPFARRTVRLDSVVSAEAVTYRPLRDYGGWGIKGWTRRKVAYNVSGTRGVLLTLADGRTVLLGSQRPDELAAAVRRGLPAKRHPLAILN